MARQRPFPRRTIEDAFRIPQAIKEKNGGNPWPPAEVAEAIGVSATGTTFFYLTSASRDYGFTEGTRDAQQISLTDLGREAVYPASGDAEKRALLQGFLNVEAFKKVLEHYGGNNLPERKFVANTLESDFGIDPGHHDEFLDVFRTNCRYLGIGRSFDSSTLLSGGSPTTESWTEEATVTVATPTDSDDPPTCFVIMPFTERDERHETGFFAEVLNALFIPAATAAGFRVETAQRSGSDIIHSTIIRELLKADLVLADLTEHNPNVLFELGVRMHEDKPVALVRAKGTGAIFDVDNLLRVAEYNPNIWPSSVETDVPLLTAHIEGTWANRDSAETYMSLLNRPNPPPARR